MNQIIKKQQGQIPVDQNLQGQRPPRPQSPSADRRLGTAESGRPVMGNMPQAGMRPMQPGMRPRQPQMQRPMQPQNRNPMQQQPMQPRTGIPQNQPHMGVPQQPRQVVPPSAAGQIEQKTLSSMPEIQAQTNTSVSLERNPYVPNFATDFNLPAGIITTKGILGIFGITFIVGMIFGSIFFGSSGGSKQRPVGLQGVIANPDITTEMKRCGLIDKGQACVLYIMNTTRYDKKAEDFFDDAVKLTEIQKFSIQMVNPKYAKMIIPPGRFAQIKIPNVR